jgi:hypothetical protein
MGIKYIVYLMKEGEIMDKELVIITADIIEECLCESID